LTAADVQKTIVAHAAQQANIQHAPRIRQPLAATHVSRSRWSMPTGNVLGVFRQLDAPVIWALMFPCRRRGQAAFYSTRMRGAFAARSGPWGSFVDRAQADGLMLNGFGGFYRSGRWFFCIDPFFPDGITTSGCWSVQ